MRLFVRSFELVVGAQVAISTVNTILTAVFLYAMGFPFKTFLILTAFVCGLVPIIGNIIWYVRIQKSINDYWTTHGSVVSPGL